MFFLFFFFNDTPTPEIYTLSLHDALPISVIHFFWDRILGTYRSPDAGQTQANGNPPDWRSRQISAIRGGPCLIFTCGPSQPYASRIRRGCASPNPIMWKLSDFRRICVEHRQD